MPRAVAPPPSIGENQAKKIALSHAGVSADKVSQYEVELDVENGIKVYEIQFKASGHEYEYDINAATGAVVKYHREVDDDYGDDHDDDDHDDDDHDDHDDDDGDD